MTTNAKDLVIPITVVLALLANAVMYGTDRGRSEQWQKGVDQTLGSINDTLREGAGKTEALSRQVMEAGLDLRDLRRVVDQQRQELSMLRDYTEGRIQNLPYRKAR
jgi:hypothetical protein